MINPITAHLRILSNTRMAATAGLWMDSPDLAGWLLDNGKFYQWKRNNKHISGSYGRCYEESMRLALSDPSLTYCEGMAMLEGQIYPVSHGWCIDPEEKVFDPTWKGVTERFYFGVPFKTEFVKDFYHQSHTKEKEMAILLWSESGWPVQTGKILVAKWRQGN